MQAGKGREGREGALGAPGVGKRAVAGLRPEAQTSFRPALPLPAARGHHLGPESSQGPLQLLRCAAAGHPQGPPCGRPPVTHLARRVKLGCLPTHRPPWDHQAAAAAGMDGLSALSLVLSSSRQDSRGICQEATHWA